MIQSLNLRAKEMDNHIQKEAGMTKRRRMVIILVYISVIYIVFSNQIPCIITSRCGIGYAMLL